MRQASVLQMQREYGNDYVRRHLGSNGSKHGHGSAPPPGTVQRDPQQSGQPKGQGATEAKGSEGGGKDPIHEAIYKLVKEQLGEEKLKKHAASAAKKAAEKLFELTKGAESEADFLEKAQLKLLGEHFEKELAEGAKALLASEDGKKLKSMLLSAVEGDPTVALAVVLAAAAAAVAADAPAELDLDGKLGKSGFKWAAKGDFGTLRDLSLKHIQASLAYSNTKFKAKLTGSYKGGEKEEIGAKAEIGVGEEKKQTAEAVIEAKVDPKSNDVKVDLGAVLRSPQLQLSSKLQFDKGIGGMVGVRLGSDKQFLAPKLVMDAEGKVTFQLDNRFQMGILDLSTSLTTGPEATVTHKLGLVQPFSVKNFNATAQLVYTVDDPRVKSAGFNLNYKLVDKKGGPIPLLIIGATGDYQAHSGDDPQRFQILGVAQGRF
jgi:hypothetical protein